MFKSRLNSKMLIAVGVFLLAICASAFAGLRDGSWEVNPAAFRYDMSLYFKLVDEDFEDLDKYEIGAFVGDECRGLAEKLDLTADETCLYMRIRSNQASGEVVDFLLRNKETGDTVVLKAKDGSDFQFKSGSRVGMPSDPYLMTRFFSVSVKTDGNGSVDFTDGLYAAGSVINLKALPNEGYHFSSWSNGAVQDAIAINVTGNTEISASFAPNVYKAVFSIDGEQLSVLEIPFGSSIEAPEAPAKEGYSFTGWTDLPETMPAGDLNITGSYAINSYKLIFKIDGEIVSSEEVQFGAPIATPAVAEKTGYTFNGWGDIPATMPAHDVEMHSSYTIGSYTLTFKIGDEVIQSSEVAYGANILAPEAPAKDGYTFAGWNELPATMPAQNLDVIGSYKLNTYNLTFKIDGEVIESANMEFGAPIKTPDAPAKEGYTFNGWGEVASTMPAADLEINGSYSVNQYTITFKIDGETIQSSMVDYGTSIVAPEAPAMEGFTFAGWAELPATMPAKDVDVIGSYTASKYTLTFRIDGEVLETLSLAYGDAIKAPEVAAKEGYTFSGWGDVPAAMPSQDLEIYGSFTVNNYTLVFKIDNEVIQTSEIAFGSSILTPEAPVREGYSFKGWGDVPAQMPAQNLEFNGAYDVNIYNVVYKIDGEVVYSAKTSFGEEVPHYEASEKEGCTFSGWGDIPVVMPAYDLEFKGSYTANIYNLTFKIGDEVIFGGQLAYGADIVVPEAPAKEGYSFSGWANVPAVMPAKDLEFDGSYSINRYTVTYKIEDEVFYTAEYEYGATIEAPEAPEKEGSTFSGWGDIPATMPAFDLVFGGTYAENFYRVTFRVDGVVVFTDDYTYGTPLTAPEAPAKEGYTFNGWGELPATMPAYNLEYDGSYTVNQYAVSFKIGDELIYSGTLAYGAEIVSPEAPAKEGYSFGGWGVVPATMPASDLEVIGSYEVNSYKLTFQIDGVDFHSAQVAYGSEIVAPEAPAKEGYSFTGWSGIATSMPAGDLVISGTYTVNNYKLSFKIDDDVIYSGELPYGALVATPEAPAKEGYSFTGWGIVPETMPASDLEITGAYAVNVYNLIFKIDGVDFYNGQLPYGSEIVVPEAPAKEGYSFAGWSEVLSTMPASDLVVSGTYVLNNYKLTFKIGEEVVFTGEVPYGSVVSAPEAPVVEGHSFSGWGMVPETMPAYDLEITGGYNVNMYTLVFKIDGEDFFTTQLPYGSEISVPEVPAKDGYSFVGWSDVQATMPASDIVISGTYSINSYKLAFKIGEEVIYAGELPYGTEIAVPEAPAKEGHTFAGWGMVPATMPASDLEISGTYDVNVYSLTFDIDGEVFFTTQLAYGSEIAIPAEVPQKDGNAFAGWGNVPTTMPAYDLVVSGSYSVNHYTLTFRIGEEVLFTGEQPFGSAIVAPEVPAKDGYSFSGWGNVPATMPSENIEFTGEYVANSYALTFKIGDEVILTEKVTYGSEVSAPEAPAKEGYTFLGWGVVPATMPAYDIEFTGAYDVNTYNVLFKIGEEVISSAQVSYGSEISVPEAPSKEGYTFAGWGNVPASMPATDLEFNGAYDVNSYALVFKIGDEVISSEEIAYGAEIAVPQVPEKTGYSFTGWGVVPATMPAYDVELTGSYDINYYSIVFKIGEEVISSSQMAYGVEITVPEAPAKDGYTFVGWGEVPAVMPADNLEFSGSYDVNSYSLTFKIGDDVIYSEKVAYGSEISAPDAPEKEGYSFVGWGVVPAIMPAYDVELTGSYDINSYSIVFKIGDEVVAEAQVPYGAELSSPEAPVKEGYTFAGWGEIPATMPADNLVLTGSYDINSYKVIFKIGDEVITESKVEYGAEIIIPEAPVKEGYSFSGWGIVPVTMPASDLEFSGVYDVNYYNITFRINGDVAYTGQLAYGADIVAPQAPESVGYTFSGWNNVPAVMPAHDLEFDSKFTANVYVITYKIGEDVIMTINANYGDKIVAPEAPEKEGYTFTGWIGLPETMPDHNVEITGEYAVNHYRLLVYVNDEVYIDEEVAYGADVVIPEPNVEYGMRFDGWQQQIPSTMPAHDLEIYGTISEDPTVSVEGINSEMYITVYSVDGVLLHKNVKASELKERLTPGIYIVNGKKTVIR